MGRKHRRLYKLRPRGKAKAKRMKTAVKAVL